MTHKLASIRVATMLLFSLLLLWSALLYTSTVYAAPMGRLFSTPDERQYLDKLRQQNKFSETEFEEEDVQIMKLKDSHVVFNGVVHRSDKSKSDVWVNGKKVTDQKLVKHVNTTSDVIAIKNADSDRYVKLKPGQKMDTNTGKVVEAYQPLSSATDLIQHESER